MNRDTWIQVINSTPCPLRSEEQQAECRASDGLITTHDLGFAPSSIDVGESGTLFAANDDQIYAFDGGGAVALREPDYESLQGELTVEGTTGSATKLAVDYKRENWAV